MELFLNIYVCIKISQFSSVNPAFTVSLAKPAFIVCLPYIPVGSTFSAVDLGLTPGSGRYPGEGNGC